MPVFAIIWPWIGIGAAGILLLVLFGTDGLQTNRAASRWLDLPWLVWLGVAAYLLHQFEEHGIDLLGQPYAFLGDLCRTLGYRDAIACPVPLSFITAVNVGSVWGAGLIAVLLVKRRPAIGLSLFGILLVNALLHMGAAVVQGRYNPGLLTACFLFMPLSLWAMSVAVTRAGLPKISLLFALTGGAAVHVVLMGSLLAYLNGFIGLWALIGLQLLNAFVPAGVMVAGVRRPGAFPPENQSPGPTPRPAAKPRSRAKLRAVE